MPKRFSDEERELIKDALIKRGIELFGKFGVRKTNVQDLTSAVGIAKGSFYSFYDSKEELFLDVFLKVQAEIRDELMEILNNMIEKPDKSLKSFIKMHLKVRNENPIIKILSDKKKRTYLIRKLANHPDLDILLKEYDYIPIFIKNWQKKNLIIEEDPSILAGILKAIFTIGMDDETIAYIGEEQFSEVIEKIIEIITQYFLKSED